MKAIRVHQFGGPEILQYDDVPLPEPGEGEARVRVESIGVNYIDTYQRTGAYKNQLPFVLGQEAAGSVEQIGAGAEVKVGERVVYANVLGSYAEQTVVPAWRLVAIPQKVHAPFACAAFLQGLTAHYLAYSTFPLKAGDTALVHAAAGGVGLLLTQIAKMRGARVIATVGSAEKAKLAREAGADDVIVYTQQDFEEETKRLTSGKGVEVVYDSVGKTTFDKGLNVLRKRGYMVLYGQASGAVPPLDPQTLNAKGSLFLTRPTLMAYTQDRAELLARANDLFGWMAEGKLKVLIDKTFALKDAAEAHRYIESRASKGKVLLTP